jgi:hypothetical protein
MNPTPVPVVSPPEVPAPQTLACANCGAALGGEYCAACGQRHEPHVHSVGHFFAEAFESITHADSRLWRTLWYLLAKPGRLTLEFFKGHRVSYLPPFRLYLVISVVFFLVATPEGSVNIDIDGPPTAARVQGMNEVARALETELASTPGAAQAAAAIRSQAAAEEAALEDGGKAKEIAGVQQQNFISEFCEGFKEADPKAGAGYAKMRSFCSKSGAERTKQIGEAMMQNIPRAMFVFLPLLALVMKALYWRPRRFYVEHLLLLVHNHAFVFLVLSILYLLQMIPKVGEYLGWLEFAVWCYIVWYIFRAMRVYYAQSRALTFGKYVTMGLAYFSSSMTVLALMSVFIAFTL